jgi:predicted transcriptional regulator of viral defense system
MRMDFTDLVRLVGDEPAFETGLLLAGDVDGRDVRRQLSRWTSAGRIHQLRRGVYMLAAPFQKVKPHPFVLANRMVQGSYVSCQSALAHYDLIPEYVPVVVSVTNARPNRWDTPAGSFDYRHIKQELFWGYRWLDLGGGEHAFVAGAEKALLDLVYLSTGADSDDYLRELRLQNLDRLNLDDLRCQAERTGSPKLCRAAAIIAEMARAEAQEYVTL